MKMKTPWGREPECPKSLLDLVYLTGQAIYSWLKEPINLSDVYSPIQSF